VTENHETPAQRDERLSESAAVDGNSNPFGEWCERGCCDEVGCRGWYRGAGHGVGSLMFAIAIIASIGFGIAKRRRIAAGILSAPRLGWWASCHLLHIGCRNRRHFRGRKPGKVRASPAHDWVADARCRSEEMSFRA